MKAVVLKEYGPPDVLKWQEVETPHPGKKEILIRIYATPVHFGDLLARKFNEVRPASFSMPAPLWLPSRLMMGFSKPRKTVLGSEFSGVVEAVGTDVKKFREGDEVFGYRGMDFGCYAEYLRMPADGVVALKPSNVSFEEACTFPYGAMTALSLLRKVSIQTGQKVLINGASGTIGSHMVQLAKHYGAEVTGVCNAAAEEMVRSLGAVKIIDYRKEDFTQSGATWDLVADVLGKSSFEKVKPVLNANGRYLRVSFKMKQLFQMLSTAMTGGKKVICALAPESVEDLEKVRELIENGRLKTVIDRRFPLEKTADAHSYVEQGNRKGHVVLTVNPAHGISG